MANYTQQLIYGQRPIHRDDPEFGQSEWYYLDPRGTDRFADMKQIDVANEKFENYNEEDYSNFLEKYRTEMKNHFREIAQKNPKKQKFLKGWLNRANGAHIAR